MKVHAGAKELHVIHDHLVDVPLLAEQRGQCVLALR